MTTRKDFHIYVKYILPTIAFILTLIVLSQLYMKTISESNLVTATGKITSILQDEYKHHKYTDNRIIIRLENFDELFYFFDDRSNHFSTIIENLHEGDTVSLKHRTRIQSLIRTGSEFKIMQLKKKHHILYSFDKAKETFSDVGTFTAFAAFGLWILYFFLRRKLTRQQGSA